MVSWCKLYRFRSKLLMLVSCSCCWCLLLAHIRLPPMDWAKPWRTLTCLTCFDHGHAAYQAVCKSSTRWSGPGIQIFTEKKCHENTTSVESVGIFGVPVHSRLPCLALVPALPFYQIAPSSSMLFIGPYKFWWFGMQIPMVASHIGDWNDSLPCASIYRPYMPPLSFVSAVSEVLDVMKHFQTRRTTIVNKHSEHGRFTARYTHDSSWFMFLPCVNGTITAPVPHHVAPFERPRQTSTSRNGRTLLRRWSPCPGRAHRSGIHHGRML